ncbi:MAG TPA: DUF5985 family protein [Tepidisphaeraceae bacterium]|nr:DUF5985 family protein [Tepidisphaeraceae bacterium]
MFTTLQLSGDEACVTSRTHSDFDEMGAAEIIYLLCAATSFVAAWMLLRYYLVRRTPLLLWSCIGFMGLAANNALVFVDLVLFREIDLSLPRTLAGAVGMMALVYGLTKDPRA